MNFDDIKDKVLARVMQIWEDFQESKLYTTVHDRYESLSALQQRIALIGLCTLGVLLVLSFPYGHLSTSSDYITEFSGKRQLIRDLLKVSREASDLPMIPPAPALDAIRAAVERNLQGARLLPEQIKGSSQISEASSLIPANLLAGGLMVNLSKLNLRQIIDLGYQLQQISPSVKVKDLSISANPEDPRYFDVVYKLAALNVPESAAAPGIEDESADSAAGIPAIPEGEAPGSVGPESEEASVPAPPAMNIPRAKSGKKPRQVR